MKKRKIVLGAVICSLCIIIGNISSSFALFNNGFTEQKVITGNNYNVQITDISNIKLTGESKIIGEIQKTATTQSINVMLYSPGDKVEYNFTVQNFGKLDLELITRLLGGLNIENSEYIEYNIYPQDYIQFKTDKNDGSIIKQNQTQEFKVIIEYTENIPKSNTNTVSLNLTSTIIYNEKEA